MMLARLWMLNFMWLLPLAGLALIVQSRKKHRAMERFADAALLDRLTPKPHGGRGFLKGLLLIMTLGLLFFALAGPRWGSTYQEVHQKGVDIMILVDVSPSMMVQDIKPHRLEQARREIIDFLRVVQGDRIGLVAFAGAAFVQCPLTLDYAALELFLNALEPGLIPVPGTDIGGAVDAGLSAFDFTAATDKVMLLITDGEDNEGRGVAAARRAAEKDVRIFVFGIGELSGGPIPDPEGKGGFKKDSAGKLILSKLNEDGLKAVAAAARGRYVRAVAGDLDLDMIYFNGIKSVTRDRTLKSGKIKVYDERFTVFVLAGFLLLLVEGLIDERKKAAERILFSVVLTLIWVLGPAGAPHALARENPDELYKEKRFAEAEKAYARLDMDHPKDIRYRYNRGCAAYRNGDYQGAMAAFSSVLRRTEAARVRFKASFNLGNAAYRTGDFASAAAYYRQALLIDPASEDARYNLELALREHQKKEEETKQQKETGPQQPHPDTPAPEASSPAPRKEDPSETARDSQPSDEEKRDQETARGRPPEKTPSENLSGKLTPQQAVPEQDRRNRSDPDAAAFDRRHAEALLDNVQEDPSRLMEFMLPAEKRSGVPSGKDW